MNFFLDLGAVHLRRPRLGAVRILDNFGQGGGGGVENRENLGRLLRTALRDFEKMFILDLLGSISKIVMFHSLNFQLINF